MMKNIVIVLIVANSFIIPAFSQPTTPNSFWSDANGRPVYLKSTYVAEGTTFFNNEYSWADLTSNTGKIYKDVRIKFNLFENQVQYIMDNGSELVTEIPIKKISFSDLVTGDAQRSKIILQTDSGFVNDPKANIYEVIDSGRVSLMKKVNITYRDEKKYSEAVTTRHFERQESDYIVDLSGDFKKLEKSRSFILEILNDRQKEVNNFITTHNLKCKSLKEIQEIVRYYNSL